MRDNFTWFTACCFFICTASGCGSGGVTAESDTTVGLDVAVDSSVVPDTSVPPDTQTTIDTQEPDTAPTCEAGTGCFGESCENADDCQSLICTAHLGEKVCSKTCDADCPDGWDCVLVGGADATSVCVSRFSHLCLPCTTSADCAGDGAQHACVTYEGEGSFCGATCGDAQPCPDGFTCQQADTVDGGTTSQCVSDTKTCACSSTAITLGLGTPCEVENEFGSCPGVRVCTEEGLTACDANAPGEEICNRPRPRRCGARDRGDQRR